MATYKIDISRRVEPTPATLFRVGFGDPAQNDYIVRDAESRLRELVAEDEILDESPNEPALTRGGLALVNGPASLPVAMVLAHHLSHRFEAVACFDPKLSKYVVAIAHGPNYAVGDLID